MQRAFIISGRTYQRVFLKKKFLTSSLWNVHKAGGFTINECMADHTKQKLPLKLCTPPPHAF